MIRTYTWGLDIARSLADAGGVGALLQISDHASGKSYLPAYDGNGNIAAVSNATTGALAAVYEYTPFGESIRTEILDSALTDQPFRFSPKWTDDESGLLNFGQMLAGYGIDHQANHAAKLAEVGIPGQLGTIRYPVGNAQMWRTGSNGLAIVGIGLSLSDTIASAGQGDVSGAANGAANTGASIHVLAGGPAGWAIGAGQFTIAIVQIGWNAHWNYYANTNTQSAADVQLARISKIQWKFANIRSQMSALGCK